MDEEFAKDNYFPIILISPMRLKLIDASYGPPLMHTSDVTVTLSCGLVHNIFFLITHLDHECPAVLGLEWLTQHNPLINWVTSSVTFQNCPRSTPRSKEDSVPLPAMANILSVSEDKMSDDTVSESSDNDDNLEPSDSDSESSNSSPPSQGTTSPRKAPYISIVSANAFVRALKMEGSRCYSISVHKPLEGKGHSATTSSGSKGSDLEGVPKLYHEFADVFSKAKADTLAPH